MFEKLELFSDVSWKRELRELKLSRMQKNYHYYRLKKQCTLSSAPLVSCSHLEKPVQFLLKEVYFWMVVESYSCTHWAAPWALSMWEHEAAPKHCNTGSCEMTAFENNQRKRLSLLPVPSSFCTTHLLSSLSLSVPEKARPINPSGKSAL